MVQESRTSSSLALSGWSNRPMVPHQVVSRTESQDGYRSGRRIKDEPLPVPKELEGSHTWGNSRAVIAGLGKIQSALEARNGSGRAIAQCNNRDYERKQNANLQMSAEIVNRVSPFLSRSYRGTYTVTPPPVQHLTLPLPSVAGPMASRMMRNSRPTAPHVGLGQFVAELPQALMLKDYFQREGAGTASHLGSRYVGLEFGIKPMLSDIQKLAEAVNRSGPVLRQFARDSGRVVRRAASNTLSEVESSYTTRWTGFGVNAPELETKGQLIRRTTIRTFANFEYFVADPSGFLGRVENYAQKSQHLLGLKLNASLAWELTPWSWLIDWHADIGGLLAYQESVADDHLVARRCGYVLESTNIYQFSARLLNPGTASAETFSSRGTFGQSTSLVQQRRSGSPYSFALNQGVDTPRRAAILASLAATRQSRF